MLLIEQIRAPGSTRSAGASNIELPDLQSCPVIEVSNVADYFYRESTQEYWDLAQDFPNVAPPWPVAWYEYRIPRWSNNEGKLSALPDAGKRLGFLIKAERMETDEMAPELVEELAIRAVYQQTQRRACAEDSLTARKARKVSGETVWRLLDEQQRVLFRNAVREQFELQGFGGGGWFCTAVEFSNVKDQHVVQVDKQLSFAVNPNGSIKTKPDGNVPCMAFPMIPTAESIASMGLRDDPLPLYYAVFLAICFAHCKNVELVENVPPPKLARAQEKRDGIPRITYSTLRIDPMRRVLKQAGESDVATPGKKGIQRALHIARGHFKDYRERGLFGRNKGIYWWDMAVRGNAEHGTHVKDYSVSAGRSH